MKENVTEIYQYAGREGVEEEVGREDGGGGGGPIHF